MTFLPTAEGDMFNKPDETSLRDEALAWRAAADRTTKHARELELALKVVMLSNAKLSIENDRLRQENQLLKQAQNVRNNLN